MMLFRSSLLATVASAALLPCSAGALTMEEVTAVCGTDSDACSEHPFVQTYVGGALDLIAMLDEETDYLGEVYCRSPAEFFDVPEIIRYMMQQRSNYTDKNAMLLVIRYLEDEGGCNT